MRHCDIPKLSALLFIKFALKITSRMEIVFASNNLHKIREINNVLGDSFKLLSLSDIKMEEDIPEDEPTLEGNALYKARFIYNATGVNVFADDTGLETEALNGEPGVHSARFAGASKDSEANIDKLLSLIGNKTNRKARFRTVIALILEGKEYLFEGTVNGNIISERRGRMGFGYDPVFVPDGSQLTFAEMDLDEKNLISHRARAFAKLKSFLSAYNRKNETDKSIPTT
jgi:XTP/dITP diphosphohydrolase